jgi:guanylate kinase
MKTKIAIVGKAASGKDHLRKQMIKQGMKFGVSTTSRPPREGEIEGKDYYFVSEEIFTEAIRTGEIVFYQQFNGNYYGITKKAYDACDCVILNVEVVNTMPQDVRSSIFVIYLNIDIQIRMERMKEREVSFIDIAQRVYADDRQYDGFTNYDLMISNPNF